MAFDNVGTIYRYRQVGELDCGMQCWGIKLFFILYLDGSDLLQVYYHTKWEFDILGRQHA